MKFEISSRLFDTKENSSVERRINVEVKWESKKHLRENLQIYKSSTATPGVEQYSE